MASGPLYELVWHTETGLGVRYADSTSPEKKAPVLWDTELFSITVSPPLHNGEAGSSKDEDLAEEKLEAVNSELNPEIKNPIEVNSQQYNRSHGQYSSPGVNSRSTDSLLSNLQKLGPNIKEVESKCAEVFGTSSNNNEELVTSAKFGSPVNSESSSKRAACGCVNLLLDHEEDRIIQCSFHRASIEFGGTESNVVAQSGEPGQEASVKDNRPPKIGNLQNNHLNTPPTRKGKSAVTDTTVDGQRFSKVRANHNRAEESSANMFLSTRKRAREGFYTTKDFGGKKLKTKGNRNNIADSAHRQGSSFVNWISTMTSGFGFAHAESMLALIPQHSHARQKNRSLLMSHGKDKGTFYSGLLSTSQTIYQPNSAVQDRIQGNLDLVEDEFSRDFQDSREEFGFGTHQIIYASTDTKLVDAFHEHGVSTLPVVSHNQVYTTNKIHGNIPCEESPSITLTDNCIHQEKSEDRIGENCSLPYIRSPSGFVPDDSASTESRGIDNRSFLPSRFGNILTDNTRPLKSLWISRLSPKVSAFISNQKPCNQGIGATEVTLNIMTEAPFPNGLASTMENIISGNLDSSSKVHRIEVGKELQDFSVYPRGSCVFKDKEVNQNLKSSWDYMLPLVQRLQSTKVPNGASCATTTCFFCGNSSHGLGGCSS